MKERSGPRGAHSHLTERIKPAPRHRRAQKQKGQKMLTAKQFAGTHCGCRYQQDYRPTLGKDGKKESGTLEVIKIGRAHV